MQRVTKGFVALAVSAALVGGAAQGAVSDKDRRSARKSASYLVDHQKRSGKFPSFSDIGSTADAIVSLAAARRGPRAINKAYNYLERVEEGITGVGLTAKVIQALAATGRSARDFEGRDLVAEILATEQASGRYGEDTAVFDHALAILALVAAGEEPSQAAKQWLADAQCDDGGWEYLSPPSEGDDEHCYSGDPNSDFFTSDTNSTSYAVQALESTTGNVPLGADPFAFLADARDETKRGWGYVPGLLTDSNSTALVIQAYAAAGEAIPSGAKKALRALQWKRCPHKGGFAYTWYDKDEDGDLEKMPADLGATIGAIPGVLEKPFPILGSMPKKNPSSRRCG